MPLKFFIAHSSVEGEIRFISEKSTVIEPIFYIVLKDRVKLFTSEFPDKFQETYDKAIEALQKKSLTIGNLLFEIKITTK